MLPLAAARPLGCASGFLFWTCCAVLIRARWYAGWFPMLTGLDRAQLTFSLTYQMWRQDPTCLGLHCTWRMILSARCVGMGEVRDGSCWVVVELHRRVSVLRLLLVEGRKPIVDIVMGVILVVVGYVMLSSMTSTKTRELASESLNYPLGSKAKSTVLCLWYLECCPASSRLCPPFFLALGHPLHPIRLSCPYRKPEHGTMLHIHNRPAYERVYVRFFVDVGCPCSTSNENISACATST